MDRIETTEDGTEIKRLFLGSLYNDALGTARATIISGSTSTYWQTEIGQALCELLKKR